MRRHRSIFRTSPDADPIINTTPLIDVMLVMLVMFIITIPPPHHMVDISLANDGPALPIADQNHVTIDTLDIIRWNDEAVDLAQLGQLVKAAATRAEPAAILLEPDAKARYLRVDQAIGAIRRNGSESIAFPGIHAYRDLI